MKTALAIRALTKFICGIALVGALLFWPAGSWAYWNGWVFIATLFAPMLTLGVVMLLRSPELLSKRLNAKESINSEYDTRCYPTFGSHT